MVQGLTVRCCLSASISRVRTPICFSCVLSFMLRQPKKIVRIANGRPMIAIIATSRPIHPAIGVFKLSTLMSIYSFIRVSELVTSFFTSSLTIKRILLMSASVNSAIPGSAIAQNSTKKSNTFLGRGLNFRWQHNGRITYRLFLSFGGFKD